MSTISPHANLKRFQLNGFKPEDAFVNAPQIDLVNFADYQNLASAIPFKMEGTDMVTGKRDVDIKSAFAPVTQGGFDQFPTTPSGIYGDKSASPIDEIQAKYRILDKMQQDLLDRTMQGYYMQQQADLAALPQYAQTVQDVAEKTKKLDYALGLQADIESPTKQQERLYRAQLGGASEQQAMAMAANAAANLKGAFAGRNVRIG
jgi:hypothetical protein